MGLKINAYIFWILTILWIFNLFSKEESLWIIISEFFFLFIMINFLILTIKKSRSSNHFILYGILEIFILFIANSLIRWFTTSCMCTIYLYNIPIEKFNPIFGIILLIMYWYYSFKDSSKNEKIIRWVILLSIWIYLLNIYI